MKTLFGLSLLSTIVGLGTLLSACEDDAKATTDIGDSAATTDSGDTSSTDTPLSTDSTDSAESDSGSDTETATDSEITIITDLPEGFTGAYPQDSDTTSNGGYMVVGALADIAVTSEDKTCANILRVVMRDFSQNHADFEGAGGMSTVEATLGEDRKPVRAADNSTAMFDEWYRNVDTVNQPFAVDLWLEPDGEQFVFDSSCFFPLDGVGFPETFNACCDNQPHSFHFTTELHSAFEYKGGEIFTFIGDDDVFVFINNSLVVDLGGIHGALEGTVDLDASAESLGLEIGKVYNFDLFQAERQTCGSNFRIETTLDFTGCGQILESDIVLD